jgi:hypothetical protein
MDISVIPDCSSEVSSPPLDLPREVDTAEEMQLDEEDEDAPSGDAESRKHWIALTRSLLADAICISNDQERFRQVSLIAKFYRELQASGKI